MAVGATQGDELAGALGRLVRGLRESRGVTQLQLATAAGMTQPAVARLEAGGTVPSLPVLARLAAALDAELTVDITSRDPHDDDHHPVVNVDPAAQEQLRNRVAAAIAHIAGPPSRPPG